MTFMNNPQPGGGFEWRTTPWGVVLQCRPLLDIAAHAFTTRDLLLTVDASEWAMVAGFLQVRPGRVRLIHQVHRAGVAVARRGSPDEWARPEADVIVSDDPDAAIGVRVADCAPILLADRRLGVVGAAHAGWRGTVQRAAAAAVDAMAREFGSAPGDLVAAIGPCLGACCGEVGEEVVRAFEEAGHTEVQRWFTNGPTPKPYLDLAGANVDQLIGAGVDPSRIHVAGLCTKTHAARLHSYRADGTAAGRMVGIIRAAVDG
jgi:YfiH family protein